MTDSNATQTGKIVIELHSKVTIYVSQLSLFMRMALQKKAETLYPFPDSTPYERESPIPVFGTPEGEKSIIPASENPEYQKAVAAVKASQDEWLNNAVLSVSISSPNAESLINIYHDELTKARAELENLPSDDFAAIVKCFLASREDLFVIYQAICQSLPLTLEEVNDSYAFFRFHVPRGVVPPASKVQESPVAKGSKQNKP